jgi:AraC family transcriptional regulator
MKTNYEYVQKAIDLFEDSLSGGAPITTATLLAGKIGYSAHYLGSLFQSLCGESLGRYLLRRRLSQAISSIREGKARPSEAYMLFGWEDYSAFSRAVKKEFGLRPAAVYSLNTQDILLTTRAHPLLLEKNRPGTPEPQLIRANEVHVTGLAFFMGMNEKGYHKPWRIFLKNRDKICSIIGNDTYQFSSWNDNAPAEDAGFWIHCAVPTDPNTKQDMLFFSRHIPAMDILSFVHEGSVETIHDTYRRIFDEYLPSSTYRLAGDFEYQHYGEDGSIRICLPIDKTSLCKPAPPDTDG